MKRVAGLLVLLSLLCLPALKASAQNTQDFSISDFTADYYLDRNAAGTATLHTVENIAAQFPSFDQNHGILRALPESYQGHTVSLKIDSVTNGNNVPLHYSTSGQKGNLVLKIGDADTYVHGAQTYKITYDTKNVANILADHDEFYWDVNGDQWQQPFGQVTARIHLSSAVAGQLQDKRVCYAGANGYSARGSCTISSPADEAGGGKLITAQVPSLYAGQTLTFAIAFDKGTFTLGPEIAAAHRAKVVKYTLIGVAVAAPALISSVYLYLRWRRYGRDPKGRGVIIPEYQPYKGLNVLSSDYILEEKLNTKAISAMIIELAIRKQVAIYEKTIKKRLAKDSKTYALRLLKDPDGLRPEEKRVIDMFFMGTSTVGSQVDISKFRSSMADDVKSLKKDLGTILTAEGFFSNNPETAGKLYATFGSAILFSGFLILLYTGIFPLIMVSVMLAGLAFLVFGRYMPSRSLLGVEVHDHMLGLRDYIKLAEADRLKFLQSPQGAEKIEEAGLKPNDPQFRVKLYESLLPYAMILNLEKDWSKQFKDVYNDSPDWYYGNWNTFNAIFLANSLSNFSSYNMVNFAPPHSSGGSGFGGGGFSGGGGGGGGGGGW